jgi:hypothetical protein
MRRWVESPNSGQNGRDFNEGLLFVLQSLKILPNGFAILKQVVVFCFSL